MSDEQDATAGDEQRLYLERAERAFRDRPVAEVLKKIKAIVGPGNMPPVAQSALAEEALESLRNGEKPSAKRLAALEFIIRMMRPAPLSRDGALDALHKDLAPAFPDWAQFQKSVKPYLYSVGRIDLAPNEGVGTGFLISEGVLVTNRHVLDILTRGTGALERGQAVVRFRQEFGTPEDTEPVDVTGVVKVHKTLDAALLKVEKQKFAAGRKPLALDDAPVAPGHPVAAIGYPFKDTARNPLFISALFENKFGVKRAAPGEVAGTGERSIFHDCSTLGGNSGSPIVSMKTARVVGLHRDGHFLFRNEAVDGPSLAAFVRPHLKG